MTDQQAALALRLALDRYYPSTRGLAADDMHAEAFALFAELERIGGAA